MKKVSLFLFVLLSLNMFIFPNLVKADRAPIELYSTSKTVEGGTVSFLLTNIYFNDGDTFYMEYDEKVLEYIPNGSLLYIVQNINGRLTVTIARKPAIDPPSSPYIEFKVKSTTENTIEVKIASDDAEISNALYGGFTRKINVVETKECPECEVKECPTNDDTSSNDDQTIEDEATDEKDNGTTKDDSKITTEEKEKSSMESKDIILYAALGSNVLLFGVIVTLLLKNKKNSIPTQIQQ